MVRSRTFGAVALLAVVAVSVAGCSGSLRSDPHPDPLAVNRAAAWAAARQAITHVLLPAGAVPIKLEPAGDHGLLRRRFLGFGTDPDRAHVILQAWWTVPQGVGRVLGFVGNHPVPGAFPGLSTGSAGISHPRAISRWVSEEWPLPGKGIASRQLWVAATRLSDGRTGVLALTDVDWVVPRPAGEVVPSGVSSVVITLVRPRHGGGVEAATKLTLRTPRLIRSATRLVDSLRAEQPIDLPCAELPVTYQCPPDPAGPGSLTLTFRGGSARQALAVARVGIPVGWAYTGVTGDPIRFWLRGHGGHTLSGASFVRQTLALAGLRERA